MAKNVIPITQAAGKKAAPLSAAQKANIAAVAAFAKQMGVKATIEGATEETVIEAVAEATTLANGDGTLYTDGALAVDSAVFNDEALTVVTADGVYGAEDGRDITVAAGIVTEITDTTAEAEGGEEAAPDAVAAAVTAALAPLMARLDSVTAEVDKFKKTVPAAPTPRARAASGSQIDPKDRTPTPVAKKSVLSGASTSK